MSVFREGSVQKTSMLFRYDDDGTVWCNVKAHGDLTLDSPYKIIPGQTGYVSEAVASGTALCMVGIAKQAWSSSDIAWLQVGGECADITLTTGTAYTAGQYVALVAGAFTSNAADNVAGIFGCVTTTASGAADPHVMLTQTGLISVTT